jgi:ATP-dependent protease HslVU (ClpYQ) peptidase subunit
MIVADANNSFELTGNGDVLEPETGAIGKCRPCSIEFPNFICIFKFFF